MIALLTLFSFPLLASLTKELQFDQGIITLTFDDGYTCHYDTVLPLLEKYHMPAIFYISTGLLDQSGYLSADQVICLFQKGHEIASHGVLHRNLKKLTSKEVEQELLESKWFLENLIQSPVINFAPPFGDFNKRLLHLLKKHYKSSRTTLSGLNIKNLTNPFNLRSLVVLNSTPLIQIEKWIKLAILEKKWLILVYHHIDECEGIVHITPATFESHLRLIQSYNMTTSLHSR